MGRDSAAAELTVAPAQALQAALLDSRQRWQDLVALSCDMAFETAADGTLVFMAPRIVLGWTAASLMGTRADALLADPDDATPFQPRSRMKRRVWLRREDGGRACVTLVCRPLVDEHGRMAGCRGIGRDITVQERANETVTVALRRAEVLDHILRQMRQEVLAPRMMETTLSALMGSLGAEGAALLDPACMPQVRYEVGTALVHPADGARLLRCPLDTRLAAGMMLVLWREVGARDWDAEDHSMVESATAIVRVILDHEAIQTELARQARVDPLTGLLNRRAFLEEMSRRIDRLSREGLPGTLMYIDVDRFKAINDTWGHELGDVALCVLASALKNMTRPSDLVARLGGDEFAVWLDGADELTAAERAEALRVDADHALAIETPEGSLDLSLSVGIACRKPGSGEDIDRLVHRADLAMYQVKQMGRGHWHVERDIGM